MSEIRPAAVAGLFYPGSAEELQATVQAYLSEWPARPDAPTPKALIVPHAGYVYSGSVAASAYRCVASADQITRVVLLGPSHRVPLRGLAVDPGPLRVDDVAEAVRRVQRHADEL